MHSPPPLPCRLGAILVLACGSLLSDGCTLSPFDPVLGPADGGRSDAGVGDGGRGDAGPHDAGRMDAEVGPADAGPRDAGLPDAGAPDAGPADAGPPDAGPPPCDDLFGGLDDYMLCVETSTTCSFYTRLEGAACADACGTAGAVCVQAHDEGPISARCSHASDTRGCEAASTNAVCVCTRIGS